MTNKELMKIVVIGASAAGLKTACRAKRLMSDCEISVFDKSDHISYGACGLPYYLSGDIENVEALMKTPFGVKRTPDFFREAKGVNIYPSVAVNKINTKRKTITIQDLKSKKKSEVPYDKLVIATGASPVKPDIDGIHNDKVYFFKYLDDALKLRKLIEGGKVGKVGIVGAGFIGCELSEAFSSMWGCDVSLFESHEQVLPAFLDPEMSLILEDYLENEGINIHKNCEITSFEDSDDGVLIMTKDASKYEVDLVVVTVGVSPNSVLAKDAGLKIGAFNGIAVDEKLLTSDPNIYAAGDCIESMNLITGDPVHFPLGSLANKQGRVVGSNLAGLDVKFKPVIGAFSVKIFDYNVTATGLTVKAAKKAKLNVDAQWGTFSDKPEYYPESKNISMKLVFDPDSRAVLGFQCLGLGDTVKRADVITQLIRSGGKVDDILDFEFAYAPPYAPALDPLFTLASVTVNHLELRNTGINPITDIKKQFKLVLDVRMKEEAEKRPIEHPRVLNVPLTEIRTRINEIPKEDPILVVCAKGSRSSETAGLLMNYGFKDVKYLGGGLLMLVN